MDCAAIADFASLIQFGAGLNLGVSILYHLFEVHLNQLHQKLKVLENSAALLSQQNAALFDAERRRLCRKVEIAAKSLSKPNLIMVIALILCGAYCVYLLIYIGFEPKSCAKVLIYTGIAASILPVPLAIIIHQILVRYKFSDCWSDVKKLEQSYFS